MEAPVTGSGMRPSVTPLTGGDRFQILAQSFKDHFDMHFGV